MREAKCISISGRSGVGKSSLMNALIAHADHLILFDFLPTRRPAAQKLGLQEVTTIDEIKHALAAGYGRQVRLWFRPPPRDQVKALDAVSKLLFDVQSPRVNANLPVPEIVLAVDEMRGCFPVTKLPAEYHHFADLCSAGRHYGICLIGASQRPSQVGTEFRGNCTVRYYLSLNEAVDIQAVEKTAGKQVAGWVHALSPYQYIRTADDGISQGNTTP